MNRLFATALLAAGLLASTLASAQIYRCTGPDGRTVFSDTACAPGSPKLEPRPNVVDTSGQRETQLRMENQALREQLEQSQRTAAAPAPAPRENDRFDSAACKSARRDHELAANSVARNQALIDARAAAMYGACGLREPDRRTTTINIRTRESAPPPVLLPQ
jgi:hypothetical protein